MAYVDETGIDGKAPVVVMVGVVANSSRLARTQEEFAGIFADLQERAANLREIKSVELLKGTGKWRKAVLSNEERISLIRELCHWVVERKHDLVLSAITREDCEASDVEVADLRSPWQAAAWHVALQLQRLQQGKPNGKGRTLLIFDANHMEAPKLASAMFDPPAWTDSYYNRGKKQGAMDQIIDTPLTVNSQHVGLVQMADLYAAIFRTYVELHDYDELEAYPGQTAHIDEFVSILAPRLIGRAHRWAKRATTSGPCMQWYVDIAPRSLLALP